MSSVEALRTEMQQAMRELGAGASNRKQQIERAAEITGLGTSIAERLRDRKIKFPKGHIVDAVRNARDTLREATTEGFVGRIAKRVATRLAQEQQKQEAKARDELSVLAARLTFLERRLFAVDPDFFGEEAIPALNSARGEIHSFLANGGEAGPDFDGSAEARNEGAAE